MESRDVTPAECAEAEVDRADITGKVLRSPYPIDAAEPWIVNYRGHYCGGVSVVAALRNAKRIWATS